MHLLRILVTLSFPLDDLTPSRRAISLFVSCHVNAIFGGLMFTNLRLALNNISCLCSSA